MKKRILAMLLAASVAILGVGCETANNNKDNSESKAPDAEYLSEEEQLFNKMFDINTYVKIEIDISNEELMKIEEDYNVYRNLNSKSPIYRKADKVTFTIGDEKYEIEEVGIRMKGNTSRTSFYSEEEGMHDLVHF